VTGLLERVETSVQGWLKTATRPFVLGICGAQGAGKSTLSHGLASRLKGDGLKVAVLSLDDLYLASEARPVAISKLFATRGVPGTHDVALGARVFDSLKSGRPTHLPRFDKANDRPLPESEWPEITAPDVIIFEGWCVGARPQADENLATPINDLEREDDGAWRRAVNEALKGPYATLFSHIARLVLLAAPGFEVVQAWRMQQEHDLSRMLEKTGKTGAKVMSDGQIAQFIQHYERLTRYILSEMPERADLTLRLDADRNLL